MRRRLWSITAIFALLLLVGMLAALLNARPTAPSPTPQVQGRLEGTAILLRDGTILVVGGRDPANGATAIAERFDPRTGLWHEAGQLSVARLHHSASLLADGSVLVVGGIENGVWPWQRRAIATVERYQPSTNRWTTVAALPVGVTDHSAITLSDGSVLVAGGRDRDDVPWQATSASWRYDPVKDAWEERSPMHLARASSSGLLIADGRPMIVGGTAVNAAAAEQSAEIYDNATDKWHLLAGVGVALGRRPLVAQLVGGSALVVADKTSLLFDPLQERWNSDTPLPVINLGGTLTSLPDGRAFLVTSLIRGVYTPATHQWQANQPAIVRAWHTATLLPDGRVVLLGGQDVSKVGTGHDVEIVQP